MPKRNVTFSPNLMGKIDEYAAAHGMSDLDAVRELVMIGLSSSPVDEVTIAAKQRAYNEVRSWGFSEMRLLLNDLATKAEAHIGKFRREET